jgi:hypothetical protein
MMPIASRKNPDSSTEDYWQKNTIYIESADSAR